MFRFLKKRLVIIFIALIFTAQAICLCCVSVAYADVRSTSVPGIKADSSSSGDRQTDRFSYKVFSAAHNRARWLYDLMIVSGIVPSLSQNDVKAVAAAAKREGLIDSADHDDLYKPLTREFIAATLCRAFHYPRRNVGYLADVSQDEIYLPTLAYYGYFLPDINNMLHPEAEITESEYDMLTEELTRYKTLHGKRMVSFGDSIMYGAGNNNGGISRMTCEKYGMDCTDYSMCGAAMGKAEGRSHIADQVRKAIGEKKQADIILLNGGTNDMFSTRLGNTVKVFDTVNSDESEFSGGFEKTMWLIKKNWENIPVVYIRSHNMNLVSREIEEKYGERGIDIAEKWGASTVDIYSESGLNTEDPAQSGRYTYLDPNREYTCDSIHPTAIGYAKFYLPLVSLQVSRLFEKEVK